jgi:hypothetical protein
MAHLTQVRRLPIWMMVCDERHPDRRLPALLGQRARPAAPPGSARARPDLRASAACWRLAGGVRRDGGHGPGRQKLAPLARQRWRAAGRPPTPDERATMQSVASADWPGRRGLVAVLVLLATMAMAVARYTS